jgi:hypothetical protein
MALALGLAAGVALWSTGPAESDPAWAVRFVRGYSVAWLCYCLAAILVTRAPRLPRWTLAAIIVIAFGLRAVAIVRTPPLSTDYWRYVWDGRMINAGVNPFRYRPDAPEVREPWNPNWRIMNFRNIPTIYPPAAEILFAALARARSQDAEVFRWSFLIFDLASILALIALLRRTGRAPARVIWYAWCPLPITEVTAGAHVDAFGLFLLLLALLLAARRRGTPGPTSALALAAAVFAKGFAVFTVPFFARRGGWRVLTVAAAACAVMLAPFLGVGRRLFTGLGQYFGHWETNSSLFFLCNWMLDAWKVSGHYGITRALSTAAILAVVVWLTWRQQPGTESLVRATFLALAAVVLLGAPTLPWYAIWVLPLLCWWPAPGGVLFSLTISMQYYGRWLYPNNYHTLLWAGYLPVYALLIGHFAWWRINLRRRSLD